jgi:hypothetical protein
MSGDDRQSREQIQLAIVPRDHIHLTLSMSYDHLTIQLADQAARSQNEGKSSSFSCTNY